jgi:hypothetical protein
MLNYIKRKHLAEYHASGLEQIKRPPRKWEREKEEK